MRFVPERRHFRRHAPVIGLAAYAAAIALGIGGVAAGVERFLASIFDAPVKPATNQSANSPNRRVAALLPTQDQWLDMVKDPAFWAGRRGGGNNKDWSGGWFGKPSPPPQRIERSSVFSAPLPRRERDDDDEATYRTVCVRLCDGAFFPLSFATTKDHFDADAAKCEKSCGSESRMYFYKNPGGEPDDMEDLNGRPYKSLGTAYLYKTKYIEQCKCRPHPWEEAAVDRHKVYALEVARGKGNKIADASLKELKAKLRQAELDTEAEKKRMAQAKLDEQKRLTVAAAKGSKAAARNSGPSKPLASIAVAIAPAPQPRTSTLPPPASPEPTAAFQPPVARQSPQSRPAASTSVTLRMGGSQAVRITPQPAWKPRQDLR